MNTDRTARVNSCPALPLHTGALMPAALGVCAAVLLGGTGFGLGCLYAQLAEPAPGITALAAAPLAPTTVLEPMGGPDESGPDESGAEQPGRAVSGPEALAALTVVPARFQVLQPGQALSMARPVFGGWVSSPFGRRLDPFTGEPAVHQGLDFAGLDNSAILAAASGVVTWAGRQRGYGNLIEIDHGNGWVTRYGHNSYNLVTPGDYVKPGQTIALMGSTGRATGTHLHFEVLYHGRRQNPARFVPRDA
jgi:murein DD-endopeptidase MepM/ murein hydrolase activator NlpD